MSINKGAIQKFAIWARKELLAQASQRAYQYGITKDGYGAANAETVFGRALDCDEQKQRRELVDQVRSKGYAQVIEEVAYTWFNRFIALRFMEVNNYLPSHIRVFSDSTGAFKPEILNGVLHLDLPGLSREKVAAYIESNETERLYRYLLLTQCNALNDSLPRMFEKMGGYTELLLPNNILRQNGVLGHMVADIPEEDWKEQVQIIGWLYQYYNSELKDETFALLKKNVKITKERIPSATQLFTPDWIVRYMVENSLGRIYIDKCKNKDIDAGSHGLDEMTWHEAESERIATEKSIADKMGWKYYLPEAEQTQDVRKQLDKIQAEYATLSVKDIKIIDPCVGSGHILVYAFDLLMQIYETLGYSQRDAAQSIIENNLYGLDIDDRAARLAYFAVMMKARQYDRRIFSRRIQPNVYAIVESNGSDRITIDYFTNNDPKLKKDFGTLVDELRDAKEYGSLLNISQVDFAALYDRVEKVRDDNSIFREIVLNSVLPLIQVAEVMAQKYDVVVTNPPYMGASSMGAKLSEFVKKNYSDSKADMFAVFMERCGQMAKKNGYQAMITQHAWMFLSSFEKLRTKLLAVDIVNMAHLGARAFEEIGGEVVQTTSFVIRKSHIADYKGEYCRLVEPTSQQGKADMFLAGVNRYTADQSSFSKIPGSPVAYWVSDMVCVAFQGPKLDNYSTPKAGLSTGDNERFMKFFWEISVAHIYFDGKCRDDLKFLPLRKKWIPMAKGGDFRRWYGNNEYVLNFGNDGEELKYWLEHNPRDPKTKNYSRYIRNYGMYLQSGFSFNDVSSGKTAFRYQPTGYIPNARGPFVYSEDMCLLGYLNTSVCLYFLNIIAPTLTYNVGDVTRIPYKLIQNVGVERIVKQNVTISRVDWDSFETSWDFKRHPLV